MLKMLMIAIILLANCKASHSVRIRQRMYGVPDAMDAQVSEDRAASVSVGAQANSAGPVMPAACLGTAKNHAGDVSNDAPSDFSKILEYVTSAHDDDDRDMILASACDSSAFTCAEIIQLANVYRRVDNCEFNWVNAAMSWRWTNFAIAFTNWRRNEGCISDPANASAILDAFWSQWHDTDFFPYVPWSFQELFDKLKQAFLDNRALKPARQVMPQHVQLPTGLRTDKEMDGLLGDMKELQLIKNFRSEAWSQFEGWLKQIRTGGEQFSGSQLVTLAYAIPTNQYAPVAVCVLLQYLEQYVTGVTCEEVNLILERMATRDGEHYFFTGLDALKSNIVDGHNKVAIVAATEILGRWKASDVGNAVQALRDVGVGLSPQNDPIFGVVKGDPVILVVDESTSMDTNFTLGSDTLSRRKFCHRQLETVLKGLPNGTHFNVIRYSSSVVKVFPKPEVVSTRNIDSAMEAVSWRGGYTPGQDPAEMLRSIQIFALEYKQSFHRSTKREVMEALRLAYATKALPSHQTHGGQHPKGDRQRHLVTKDFPQIYFLTSGQPGGEASRILSKISYFDSGRSIPVNSIFFGMPTDVEARKFAKDLANITGGFFRSIQQAS